MKRVLILASVASMVEQFNMPYIELLQNMGYKVDVACNFLDGNTCSQERIKQLKQILREKNVLTHQICFARNITKVSANIRAYKQVKQILVENRYEFLHCHSPIGGVVGRLAGHKTKTKVIYTVHGFHFFQGAPLKNWLLYYPIEKLCSYWTDVLITINHEDYALARKKMRAKKVVYIPGVGIDLKKFGSVGIDREEKRKELGLKKGKLVLLSVGELNENKNHETVIHAIADMDDVYYIVVGKGERRKYLQRIIDEYGIAERVKLLGYRSDVKELCAVADVFIFPSFREGLSVSLMEAMASGLPVVCSQIRGNVDLVDENGGIFFDPHSVNNCKNMIKKVFISDREKLGKYNTKKIKKFSSESVNAQMEQIMRGI